MDASVETMTVLSGEEEYVFSSSDAKKESLHGFLSGEEVEITYQGTYQKGMTATRIKELTEASFNDSFPKAWSDEGVFRLSYQQAYQTLQQMSLEEKIGQVILARFPEQQVFEAIQTYHVGGFVLFGRDFKNKTKEEVKRNLSSYQETSQIPLIFATDEEGGTVVRVSRNPSLRSSPFSSPQEVYQKGGMEAIRNDTLEKANLLSDLGIHVNLAPVADVSSNPSDFIYQRSFGQSASATAHYITNVAVTYQNNHFGFVLKHFPGYGNNQDTHTGIAFDARPLQQFQKEDFLPFKAGIQAGAPSILVSHNVVMSIDSLAPASLSKSIHEILRNDLHFTGVIMTDDLAMGAIAEYTKGANPAIMAFLAGNDFLLTTDYVGTYQALKEGVYAGKIPLDQLDHSVFLILAWKYQLGLFMDQDS